VKRGDVNEGNRQGGWRRDGKERERKSGLVLLSENPRSAMCGVSALQRLHVRRAVHGTTPITDLTPSLQCTCCVACCTSQFLVMIPRLLQVRQKRTDDVKRAETYPNARLSKLSKHFFQVPTVREFRIYPSTCVHGLILIVMLV